jgi:hypothetical protein
MIFKRLSARADTGIPGFLICGAARSILIIDHPARAAEKPSIEW